MKTDIYTYPVLGIPDHFSSGYFAVALEEMTLDTVKYQFTFKYELNEPTITAHINSGNACVVIRVRNRAFYSELFEFESDQLKVEIPLGQIGEDFLFQFDPFVVAKKSINGYHNQNAEPIRAQYVFNLIAGNKMAIGAPIKVIFDEKYQRFDLAGSFLKLRKVSEEGAKPALNFQAENAIFIDLNPTDFTEISKINNSSGKNILLGNMVFPVLIELLWQLKTKEVDPEEYDWGSPLIDLLGRSSTDEIEPFEDAQELLRNPIGNSCEKVNQLIFEEDED